MPPISAAKQAEATMAAILASVASLHAKMDSQPKCECASLKLEVADLKALIAKTNLAPPPLHLRDTTYEVVKKALNDASTYADKACRAVWVGRTEALSPSDTLKSDQTDLEQLFSELNDPLLSQALSDGKVTHHRHPELKGDRKKRILKIGFPDQKTRDRFLTLSRSIRPPSVTKLPGNFLRRDLCPYELELERQARVDAFTNNIKIGGLAFGVRDEKLVKFNGTPRLLPPGYATRPPRGYLSPLSNPSDSSMDISNQDTGNSILSSLSPIHKNNAAVSVTSSGGRA